jgi:hypothetical protein
MGCVTVTAIRRRTIRLVDLPKFRSSLRRVTGVAPESLAELSLIKPLKTQSDSSAMGRTKDVR